MIKTQKFLAINSAQGACSVAIGEPNEIIACMEAKMERGHSDVLFPIIYDVLKNSSLKINQLDGFFVCTGPGNYTSLRIAVSAIRGLALAGNKPAIGMTLFELLTEKRGNCLVIIQGPVDKVYIQKFHDGVQVMKPKLIGISELMKMQELSGMTIIGFKAKEIAKAVGGLANIKETKVSFKRIFSLGFSKLELPNIRPSPLYVR